MPSMWMDTEAGLGRDRVRLLDPEPVSFDAVLARYRSGNDPRRDSWTIRNLRRADAAFEGWVRTKISIGDVGRIVLPFHVGGCDRSSDLPQTIYLIPPSGLTVQDAHARFIAMRDRFGRLAPHCHDRIVRASQLTARDFGCFFLSQEPLLVGSTYGGLTAFRGRLTHLDGLHRLIGLMESIQPPPFIDCCVAVRRPRIGT